MFFKKGKLHIDLYRSEDKEIIQLLYFENTIYVLHSNFSLLVIITISFKLFVCLFSAGNKHWMETSNFSVTT